MERIHVARDVNGDAFLWVLHEDTCVSLLSDTKPRPTCVATFTRGEFLKAVAGVCSGELGDEMGQD